MEYHIEENVKYIVYPYEHPFDNAWRIELGCGKFYYIYIDQEPFLAVQANGGPFTEAVIFHDYLAIGDYDHGIYFINLEDLRTKEIKNIQNYEIEWYFGYFVINRDVLYVLGAKNIIAFDHNLQLLWKSDWLAIDGVVFESITDDTMTVQCEMDPPGGWINRTISLKDGKIINDASNSPLELFFIIK